MVDLGTKLTIGGLFIRAIGYAIRRRRKNPVVVHVKFYDGPKTEIIEIQANTVPEVRELIECVERHRQASLN